MERSAVRGLRQDARKAFLTALRDHTSAVSVSGRGPRTADRFPHTPVGRRPFSLFPPISHAVHRFDVVEARIDCLEFAADAFDVRGDRVVV